MFGERILTVLAALLAVAVIGFTSAPPVWASGVSPMGFFVVVLVVSLYQPQAMPAWLIVPLSLLNDAALGAPYGLSGMAALVAVMALGRRARSYQRQAPWFAWIAVMGYLGLAQLLLCVLAGLFGLPVSGRSAMLAWMVSAPFVPPLQWLVARASRATGAV